tara:strand:- start:6679 stop:7647 length:969 start_codon:yes stop_codon:yes gene_type:complete
MNRVLIVDALNQYYRAYIVDPSISTNGQPIGGIKGFFKILQKLVRETKPDRIVICWDGAGGSKRRKGKHKDYKSGRKPIRLNREIRNLTENEEMENKIWQQARVIEYLNQMPMIQLMLDNVEADDLIGYITSSSEFAGWQKIIVSSDKDFFQLADEETVIYRPVQKEILNAKRLLERFEIHPNNFAIARAMAGDKSDNIKGVGGIGLPTAAKRLPMLRRSETVLVDDLVDYAKAQIIEGSKLKVYDTIIEQQGKIELNYKLMQLYVPNISPQGKAELRETFKNSECAFNKTEVQKMMIMDGFGEFNWSELAQVCRKIVIKIC